MHSVSFADNDPVSAFLRISTIALAVTYSSVERWPVMLSMVCVTVIPS